MDPAWISLLALVGVILASRQERVNIGILAVVLAGTIGFYSAGMDFFEISRAFPLSLFRILLGVAFFFGLAQVNGTLDKIAHLLIRLARGKTVFLPIIFFVLPLVLAAIGPGNIAAVALLAPLAMAIAGKTGITAFFMTIMLVNGANAGTFSPFSPTGIIANGLIERLGLAMNPWTQVFLPTLLAQSFVALCCYAFFIRRMRRNQANLNFNINEIEGPLRPFDRSQIVTILAIAILVLSVMVFRADIGFMALGLAMLLLLGRISNGKAALGTVPWNVIVMVCGVSMLVNIMERTGGLDLFTSLLAKISNPENVTGVLAFVVGIISSYSSSSAVVMPTFIPLVPGLIEKIGGSSAQALIASINVGSHLVDVSPLSTLGALCIANAAARENKNKLFNQLLGFGLSMSLFGAVVCYIFFGLIL